jgi:hypothetical protein
MNETEGIIQIVGAVLVILSTLGGIAGIIAATGWSKAERIRAEGKAAQKSGANAPSDAVLAELKILTQQMAEMQTTSHQFDLSFDAALDRLESRVGRLETKAAATTATPAVTYTPGPLRNGQSS